MQVEIVSTQRVACYGASPSSHPRVYLPLDPIEQIVVCPYCSINYVHENATKVDKQDQKK